MSIWILDPDDKKIKASPDKRLPSRCENGCGTYGKTDIVDNYDNIPNHWVCSYNNYTTCRKSLEDGWACLGCGIARCKEHYNDWNW